MNGAFRRQFAAASVTVTAAAAAVLIGSYAIMSRSDCDDSSKRGASPSQKQAKLLFLGTGSSTGCPRPICSLLFHTDAKANRALDEAREHWSPFCQVSNLAIHGDPKFNKNYRNNPSLLISHHDNGECKNIVIDVGKTFREGALRWFPTHGISSLDGIVLTHQHMDAAAGLDDIRGFQSITGIDTRKKDELHGKEAVEIRRVATPVYLSQFTLQEVSSQFPWLFPKQQLKPVLPKKKDEPIVKRDVSAFDVHVIEPFKPFEVAGLTMIPLPVWHGDDLICLGFAFSVTNAQGVSTNVVYLSDISRMIPETLEYIQNTLPPTDILVVDSLLEHKAHAVHFSMDQAMDLARTIRPRKQTYLVGMSCDSFLPHDEMNKKLSTISKDDGVNVKLAHDGLVLNL